MYALKKKMNMQKKVKNNDRTLQKCSTPLYVFREMPGHEQAGGMGKVSEMNTIVQRYPVEVGEDGLKQTAGRPPVPRDRQFLVEVYDRIKSGVQNPFEEQFIIDLPDREKGVRALQNGYRSREGLALCHKVSIDDIERMLVCFANSNEISEESREYLRMVGIDADRWLGAIQRAASIQEKARLVNLLIETINEDAANYYLGDADANSSIQQHPDAHCDQDGCATPISGHIMDNWEEMGISSPKNDGSGGYASSNFGRWW